MVQDVAAAKRAARTRGLASRRALSASQRRAFSAAICANLTRIPELAQAPTIAGFAPFKDEADIRNFAANSVKDGRNYYLPRVVEPGRALTMHKMCGSDHNLTTGYGGILEPSIDSPQIQLDKIAAALIPSVSVDRLGMRLGYGLGFYDITICSMLTTLLIAPIFSCQLTSSPLPSEPHDRRVDLIVTEIEIMDLRS